MTKKYYAVKVGHRPGIYLSWDDCKVQVEGFAGAKYKGFPTREEAEEFVTGRVKPRPPAAPIPPGTVVIYSDGACSGNPGPGGYGAVILSGDHRTELSAGFRRTTNNRMEMLGCIVGMESLTKPSAVTIFSDSKYVVDAVTKSWATRWRANGWKRRLENGEMADASNADLWARMLELCESHKVRFEWVRGHSGNKENERCDELAVAAAAAGNLGIDTEYEQVKR